MSNYYASRPYSVGRRSGDRRIYRACRSRDRIGLAAHRERRLHLRRHRRQRRLGLSGPSVSAPGGRHPRRRLDRRLGDGSRRHRVEPSFSGRHRGHLLGDRRRHGRGRRQKLRAALQRQRRRAAPSRAPGRLQFLDRPRRDEHLDRLGVRVREGACAGASPMAGQGGGSASPGRRSKRPLPSRG